MRQTFFLSVCMCEQLTSSTSRLACTKHMKYNTNLDYLQNNEFCGIKIVCAKIEQNDLSFFVCLFFFFFWFEDSLWSGVSSWLPGRAHIHRRRIWDEFSFRVGCIYIYIHFFGYVCFATARKMPYTHNNQTTKQDQLFCWWCAHTTAQQPFTWCMAVYTMELIR